MICKVEIHNVFFRVCSPGKGWNSGLREHVLHIRMGFLERKAERGV